MDPVADATDPYLLTLFVPSHSLYGSRGLIRPAQNPALILGAGRHCTRNLRWWADSPAEARAKMISWCEFAGLRETTPKETKAWAKEWDHEHPYR